MIKFILLILSLMVLINSPISDAIVLSDFQQEALRQHNYYRQLHCVGSLILNSSINAIAQAHAEHMASIGDLVHSGTAGLGENIFYAGSSATFSYINGSVPTRDWYNEISKYNFVTLQSSGTTGHFTQVVWKGSTQLGIGAAFTSNNSMVFVSANYYPPGNVGGQYADNVLALCAGGD